MSTFFKYFAFILFLKQFSLILMIFFANLRLEFQIFFSFCFFEFWCYFLHLDESSSILDQNFPNAKNVQFSAFRWIFHVSAILERIIKIWLILFGTNSFSIFLFGFILHHFFDFDEFFSNLKANFWNLTGLTHPNNFWWHFELVWF